MEFVSNRPGASRVAEAPDGGALVDICDAVLAPVAFSCRAATCGTCKVEILEGQELLEPPGDAEREMLALLRARGHERLACQARVKAGPGRLRLRALGA